jgi:hypothetical protein
VALPPPEIVEPPSDPVAVANALITRLLTRSPYRDYLPRTLHEAPLATDQEEALHAVAYELHHKLLREPHIRVVDDPAADYTLHLTLETDAVTGRRIVATLTPAGSAEPAWTARQPY